MTIEHGRKSYWRELSGFESRSATTGIHRLLRNLVFVLLSGSITLTGCNPMNTQAPMTDVHPDELVGAKAKLVDEARQIYRFSNGVCRALADIPAPWTLSRGDYDDEPIHPRVLSLEAPNAAFGIPPPGLMPSGGRRHGRGQIIIDLGFAPPTPDHWREDLAHEVLQNPEAWGRPRVSPVPISDAFTAYTSNDSDMMLVNQPMQAAVWCIGGTQLAAPNPRCHGFVFLRPDEKAGFLISYEGLSRLTEVVESVTKLAASIRVECPNGVHGDE